MQRVKNEEGKLRRKEVVQERVGHGSSGVHEMLHQDFRGDNQAVFIL